MKTWLFEVSEHCNMNCSYCTSDVNNEYVASNKTFDNFYETLKLSEPYKLDIFGGEPLIQTKLIQYIINKIHDDKNCISIFIPTNGTIINDEVKKILSYTKVKLSISHDGLNQSVRGNNKLHIKELSNESDTTSHTMIVGDVFTNDSNYLVQNHLYLESLGLNPDMTIVRDMNIFNKNQIQYFKQDYKKYIIFIKQRIDNKYYSTFEDLPGMIKRPLSNLFEFAEKGIKKRTCGVGVDNNAVTPQGEIIPCIRMTKDRSIQKDFENQKHKDYFEACNTCQIRDVCDRGCLVEHIRNKGLIVELCEIYKIIYKELYILLQDKEHAVQKLYKGIQ